MSSLATSRGAPVSRIARTLLPVFYAAAGFRLLKMARNRSDLQGREIGIAVTAAAIASSTLAPGAQRRIEALTGDANYGRFISQVGTLVAAAYGDAVMVRSVTDPGDSAVEVQLRRRRMVRALVAMTALFSVNRATASELQSPTATLYRPVTAAYWLVFSGFMARTAGELAPLAFRTSRVLPERSFRVGLRAVSTGAALLGVFYGQLFVGAAAGVTSRRFPEPLRGVRAQGVIQLGGGITALGACLPTAVARWQAVRPQFEDAWMSAQLAPVWRHVRATVPAVTLSVGPLSSPEFRLFRRVVEVLDGLDRLASWHDPAGRLRTGAEDIGRAHGLSVSDCAALHRASLLRYARDHPSPADSRHTGSNQAPATEMFADRSRGLTNFRPEARRLLRTRHLLDHSALPALVAQRAYAEVSHQPKGYSR